jgi:hypothetical protein
MSVAQNVDLSTPNTLSLNKPPAAVATGASSNPTTKVINCENVVDTRRLTVTKGYVSQVI